MSKKLAFFFSLLVVGVLVLSTGVYFQRSERLLEEMVRLRAEAMQRANEETIELFLRDIKSITRTVYLNKTLQDYLDGKESRETVEDFFMNVCENVREVQALRVLDKNGDIQVFIRECMNLSGSPGYKPISIAHRDFIQTAANLPDPGIVFSNFERGRLPDATNFCPSMIRAVMPYFEKDGSVKGFLVVNFWGQTIGIVANRLQEQEGVAFIVEVNAKDEERNGIFLFHRKHAYEFANQMGHNHTFQSVYGADAFEKLKSSRSGFIRMNDKRDYLAFTTVSPYGNDEQVWKLATYFTGDIAFKSLSALKWDFIRILSFSTFLSVLMSVLFSRYFFRPLARITQALGEYGAGNFDYEPEGEFSDELAVIATSVRGMAGSLKRYVADMEQSGRKIELLNRISSLGVFSAGVSHELATPLNSILITCRLMKDEVREDQREEIETIESQAFRCVQIIDALKTLTPYSSSTEKLPVDMQEVVNTALTFLKPVEGVETEVSTDFCRVDGNRTLLVQAVLNLLTNALDAVYPAGKIWVRLETADGTVRLTVEDDGHGVSEQDSSRIFDPFYTTKSPDKGTGLGLTLVHTIVSDHGGTITMTPRTGGGTVFTVEFHESSDR